MGAENLKSIVWVVPEKQGGIKSYSEPLIAQLKALKPGSVEVIQESLSHRVIQKLQGLNASVIHVQHEFGILGSKVPGFYHFPRWVRAVRTRMPQAKIVATGHTVLGEDFQYPLTGMGIQIPFRWFANQFLVNHWMPLWTNQTWGILDGVLVHSKIQENLVRRTQCPKVATIPHYVPEALEREAYKLRWELTEPRTPMKLHEEEKKKILVFGFFSPEKGQDVVIEALPYLAPNVHLVLAGGARRQQDTRYLEYCTELARKLQVRDRITITGFVESKTIPSLYEEAALVIAPFRETSGSGSLVHAIARGAPILVSDHPINRDLEERVPGCVAFFKRGDAKDCALKIQELLGDKTQLQSLSAKADEYAKRYSVERTAIDLIKFYESLG